MSLVNIAEKTNELKKRIDKEDEGIYYFGMRDKESGVKDGYGIMILEDGSIRDGSWKSDEFDGPKCKEITSDGYTYEGDIKSGKRHGEGVLKMPDQSIYTGQFKEGDIWGKGKMEWNKGSNTRKYDGDWKKGKMDGKGHYKWDDGREYFGEYRGGRKFGVGSLAWPDGRKY